MTVSLLVNQVICAAAVGVALASFQAGLIPAYDSPSGAPGQIEAPAVQTVNRAAKSDKLKNLLHPHPGRAPTPDEPSARVIIAGQYEVVAATPDDVDASNSEPLFTLQVLPSSTLISTDGRGS